MERRYIGSFWGGEPTYTASAPGDVPLPSSSAGNRLVRPLSEPASDVLPADPPPVVDAPVPVTPVEAAICAYPWECDTALRVAACESGSDYAAGYNGSGHAGTFQISPIHAWRFSARGLDFWTHALILEVNLEIAYEIYKDRWWYAWSCF